MLWGVCVCVCVVENRCGCVICPKNIFRFHITGKTFGLNGVFYSLILFYSILLVKCYLQLQGLLY